MRSSTIATSASLNGTSVECAPGTNIDPRIDEPWLDECARKNTAAMLNMPKVATESAARPKRSSTLPKSQTCPLDQVLAADENALQPPHMTNVHAAPCHNPTSRNANSRFASPRSRPRR